MQWMGRNLWDMSTEYCNAIFNELFIQIDQEEEPRPDTIRPQLILRERPFPTKANEGTVWDELPTFPVSARNIQRRQISKGAPESNFNFWLFNAKGLAGDGLNTIQMIHKQVGLSPGTPGSVPIYNLEDMRKHGLRKWEQASAYFPWRERPDFLGVSAEWLTMVHDWYAVMPYALSGTLTTTEMFPELVLGAKLTEVTNARDMITYYIEGVTQQWQYPGAGSTVLNVTRGEYFESALLDIVYEKYSTVPFGDVIDAALSMADQMSILQPNNYVPHGSGVQLDRAIGQIDTPERLFLRSRGKLESDVVVQRGEPTYRFDERGTTRAADLPNRQLPKHKEELFSGEDPETARTGSLTQRELENGTPLPVREDTEVEPGMLQPADRDVLNQRTARTKRARVR
jgi:hypothetical protein